MVGQGSKQDLYHPIPADEPAQSTSGKANAGNTKSERVSADELERGASLDQGPAPPYTERDPSYMKYNPLNIPKWINSSTNNTETNEKRRKIGRYILYGIIGFLALITLSRWSGSSQKGVGHIPGGSEMQGDLSEWKAEDGEAQDCAVFNDDTEWTVIDHDHHHDLPDSENGHILTWFSTSTSFNVPIRHDIFNHLRGPVATSKITVSTHEHGSGYSDDEVHVTVKPMVSTHEGQDVQDSLGYKFLLASDICRMAKNGKVERDGVGIYTAYDDDHPHGPEHGNGHNRLRFRVHVSLPANGGKGMIPALGIDGPVGSINVEDISQSKVGDMSLKMGVGDIHSEGAKADSISASVTGGVHGRFEVGDNLKVDIPTGEAELQVTLGEPISANVDQSAPYNVQAHVSNGQVKLEYEDWKDIDRALQQDITVPVGSVHLSPHPLYEGPFQFKTSVGSINVDLPSSHNPTPDPLGKGRTRHVDMRKKNGLTSRLWTGEVYWSSSNGDKEMKGDGSMNVEAATGTINVKF